MRQGDSDAPFAGDCGLSLASHTRLFGPGNSDQSRPNSSHARRTCVRQEFGVGRPLAPPPFAPHDEPSRSHDLCRASPGQCRSGNRARPAICETSAFHRLSPVPDANSLCSRLGAPVNTGVYAVANGACHQALNPVQSRGFRCANGGSCGKE